MRATLTRAGETTIVTFDKTAKVEGPHAREVLARLQPDSHVAYGPVFGPYLGYDPNNEDQVVDALGSLESDGFELTVEGYDPPEDVGEYLVPDNRDPHALWVAMTPEEQDAAWRRGDDLEEIGKAVQLDLLGAKASQGSGRSRSKT